MYKGLIGIVLAGVAGCSASPVDLAAAGRVKVANSNTDMVDLAPPKVEADHGSMVVTGTLTRHPGFNGPVPGRLDVTVVAADGKTVLQQFSTGWDPPHIPVDGDRRATYVVRYGWLPPDGATVRVDHATDLDEDPNSHNGKYSPHYRGTDDRIQLLDGLGGDRSWSNQQQQRFTDNRIR